MPLPEAKLTIQDGGLGLAPAGGTNVLALIGACSGGVPNTVYAFSDPTTLQATLGTGPLVEAAAYVLAIAGGVVVCVKTNTTTPGTSGAVTRVGTGTSTCAASGAPLDSYLVQVLIVQGGATPAAGTATLKWSLDGGRTYSAEVALSTSGIYVIPGTGITLTFTANTLVAGDTYSFTATGPAYNVTDFGTAFDVLAADTSEYFQVYAVGVPADAATMQALYAAFDTKLAAAQNAFRFTRGIMSAIDDTDANIKTAGAALAGNRVMVAAGFVALTSTTTGFANKRPAATVIAARAADVPPSEDLARVASGPLPGVLALYRDEGKTPGLDAAGYATLRTYIGMTGFYVANGRIKAPAGSDYQYLQYARVMDIAARAVRRGELRFLNDTIEVYPLTAPPDKAGRITERGARVVEAWIERCMRDDLGKEVVDVQAQVDRTTNILSTSRMPVRYVVLPKAYAKTIDGTISLVNPAFTLA